MIRSPGAAAIIAMRWAQVPLWLATFLLLSRWMRRAGLDRTARWSAILLALCSSMFMLPAVEYRIESLGCALYILALVLLQDAGRSAPLAFAGGAVLCLAGFANIRLGPLLALTALVLRIVRPGEHSWGGSRAANGIFAGVIAAFAACSVYFAATRSAAIAFRRVWTENYLGDRLSEGTAGVFLHRLAGIVGLRPLDRTQPLFDPASIEVATFFIMILGTIGMVRALAAGRRAPDHLFVLAFLQIGNILFIAAMKFIYTYHFEMIILLMLPFVAAEIERLSVRRWSFVVAGLLVASAVNVFGSLFRGKEGDLAYQDLIMREADRLTRPDGKVFDGVGWALRRHPAYRYWFLPKLVQSLEAHGLYEPYAEQQMASDPPAAIISDHNAYAWFVLHPQLAAFTTRHYLPYWRNLWIPAMNARLEPMQSAEWIVPASDTYDVYASNVLATHPWFRSPLLFGTFESRNSAITLMSGTGSPLQWTVDGAPIGQTNTLSLRKGQRLRAASLANQPLGIMIVPQGIHDLFRQPPHGVTIEAAASPVTHVPFR